MKKAFIIKLTDGDGDLTFKLVDEETWNWVNNPKFDEPKIKRNGYWDDLLCPSNVRTRIENEHIKYGAKFDGVWIGSFPDNDRAILAPPLEDNEKFANPYSTTAIIFKMIKSAENLGYVVDLDEYSGVMY